MRYIRQHTPYKKSKKKNPYKKEKQCRQNNEYRQRALPFPLAVTSCAVQFYLHYSLISQRTVQRLPIGKDSQELCVPSRLDVYRRQSNFFFINQDKNAGRLPDSSLKMHTFTQARRRRRMDEYICVALSGEPLALKIKHFRANWFLVAKVPTRLIWMVVKKRCCPCTSYHNLL